jgi:hypothetical protein
MRSSASGHRQFPAQGSSADRATVAPGSEEGAQLSILHSTADDNLLKVANSFIAAPSLLPRALAEIVVAAAVAAGTTVPSALVDVVPSPPAEAIAASLASVNVKRFCSATSPNNIHRRRNCWRWRRHLPRSPARSSAV